MYFCRTIFVYLSLQGTFAFSLIKYTPLKYNNEYVYPWWGYVIGWLLALSSMVCIPLWMVYKISTTQGTLKEVRVNPCDLNDMLNQTSCGLQPIWSWQHCRICSVTQMYLSTAHPAAHHTIRQATQNQEGAGEVTGHLCSWRRCQLDYKWLLSCLRERLQLMRPPVVMCMGKDMEWVLVPSFTCCTLTSIPKITAGRNTITCRIIYFNTQQIWRTQEIK